MSNAFEAIANLGTSTEKPAVTDTVSYDHKFGDVANPVHETLFDEAVVEFTVPSKKIRFLKNPEGEEYAMVGFRTGGGYVNLYIYHKKLSVQPGETLTGQVVVRMKTMANGQRYLYVELRPSDNPVDHMLSICNSKGLNQATGACRIFHAYKPTYGGVLLAPSN